MSGGPQIEKALQHLAEEPYGFRIFRTGERRTAIRVDRLTGTPSVVSVTLTTGGLAHAQINQLSALGWISGGAEGARSALKLKKPVAAKLDPGSLLALATRTLDIASGLPTTEDETSDPGWVQFGCLLAAPGMVLGALIGLGAATHFSHWFLAFVIQILLLVGSVTLSYAGGGLLALVVLRLVGTIRPIARYQAGASLAGWFIGAFVPPVLINWVSAVMGW
jgi:hypothetical protein